MLNFNEDDLKAAIVQKAADEFLSEDHDLSGLIGKEIKVRLDKIFADRAEAQIKAVIDEAVLSAFDREYQKVNAYGVEEGPKTSIRKQLDQIVTGYWIAKVEPKTGKPTDCSYSNTVTRAEYLMTTICAQDFTDSMKQSALNVTGALKDGLRNQMGAVMDGLLNELFRVKSPQDQGKVVKPY